MKTRLIRFSVTFLAVATVIVPRSAIFAAEPEQTKSQPPTFQTVKVVRGALILHVRATGTLEPEEVVDVCAQVDGRVVAFGDDTSGKGRPVDYNSKVEKGEVLAIIDDGVYRAQLDAAQAGMQVAQAQLVLAKAKLQAASTEVKRATDLQKVNAISRSDLDVATANEPVAKAGVDIAEAEIAKQKGALRIAELNLEATKIKSPVAGIIIDRRVNVGQTVVASLNAPSLFLIARDLKKLQIWASVNEADIGQIQVGQNARFTIDAFPDRSFQGKVLQVRLNAQMTQNVVTYTVVVSVDNPDGKLLPYLTANLQFETARHNAVLVVPKAALRWRPHLEWIAPDSREKPAAVDAAKADATKASEAKASEAKMFEPKLFGCDRSAAKVVPPHVWVRDGKFVRPVDVQVGISDETVTEILAGDLKDGDEVVVEAIDAAAPAAPKSDPFGMKSGPRLDLARQQRMRKTVQDDSVRRRSPE